MRNFLLSFPSRTCNFQPLRKLPHGITKIFMAFPQKYFWETDIHCFTLIDVKFTKLDGNFSMQHFKSSTWNRNVMHSNDSISSTATVPWLQDCPFLRPSPNVLPAWQQQPSSTQLLKMQPQLYSSEITPDTEPRTLTGIPAQCFACRKTVGFDKSILTGWMKLLKWS